MPEPKRWWQEYATVFIAVLALVVSAYSTWLSRKDFIATHRPYVYVSSREDDKGTMDVKSVLICCLNAPAKIINHEFCYLVVKTKADGTEQVAKTLPLESSFTPRVLYPPERTNSQVFFPYDLEKDILAKDPEVKLRREARIDYKELSSDRTYHLEGNWDYKREFNVWQTRGMFGD